jgi:predicted enzyme related to lactoylglutathione lyase
MTEPVLGLIVLRSGDLVASLAFYRAIGLSFVEERHGSGPVHYSCQSGTTVIEIYPETAQQPQDYQGGGATLLDFNVKSLDAVLERMKPLDVPVLKSPKSSTWGRRAVVQDPDGRAVELNEPVSE